MRILLLLIVLTSPSWGALAFVQASAGEQTTNQTTVATGATATTTGNTLVVFVDNTGTCEFATTSLPTITDTAGDTFLQISVTQSGLTSCMRGWIARNITANATNVITATFGVGPPAAQITATEFSGISATIARDMTFSTNPGATVTTITSSKFSTFYADEIIVVGAFKNATGGAWTASSGYTIPSGATTASVNMTTEYKILSATVTATTVAMSQNQAAVGMAIQGIGLR